MATRPGIPVLQDGEDVKTENITLGEFERSPSSSQHGRGHHALALHHRITMTKSDPTLQPPAIANITAESHPDIWALLQPPAAAHPGESPATDTQSDSSADASY